MTFYASYPVTGGSGGGVPTYTNLGAFPSAVGAGNGSLAIALNTDILYISNGTVWEPLADPTISPLAITALTGDGTATGPGSAALTLATVNSNVGSFGSASSVMTQTVNAKGLTTAAANVSIQIVESQVTNLVSDLAAKQSTTLTSAHILVGNGSNVATDVPVSGDLTAANTGAFTFNTVNSNVGSFGTATAVPTVTVNAKGLVTAAADTPIQITESQVTNLTTDLAAKQSTTLTNAHILLGNGSNVATDVPMSGDVTIANTGATTIANLAVTNAKIANTTIDLTAKVTGILPTANGGTGQNSTATFPTSGVVVTEAASETLTNKTISGSSNTLTVLAGTQLSGQVPIANGGTAATTANAGFNNLSPLTTKGDIVGFSTVNARLAVGSNGQVLTADSAQTLGLSWTTVATYTRSDVATSATINALSSSTSFVRLTGSTTTTVNGITAGTAGQLLEVYNVSTANVTFTNQNGSATSTNRTIIPTGVSYLLKPGYSTWFIYDDSQSRWICQATDIPVASRNHYTNAGQTITSGTFTAVKMTVSDYDTHSAYDSSTGIFTVPVNGLYFCAATVIFTAFAVGDTTLAMALFKNGTEVSEAKLLTSATNNSWGIFGNDVANCVVGDTLEMRVFQNTGSNRTAGFNETCNYVAFTRNGA